MLALFGPVLSAKTPVVLSSSRADLFHYFFHWRQFGFSELAQGNLALWNPHVYSGVPFLGAFQPALLYPPNLVFLILPLNSALNFSMVLHIFLAGVFASLWARNRGFHPAGCFVSGVLFMCSSTVFLRIYAGHLSNLCAVAWAPLLFLAVDWLCDSRSPKAIWLGAFALAMQIFAGHPQYVYYTGLAAGVYGLLRLWRNERPLGAVCGLFAMAVFAGALGSVQLLTGWSAAKETIRSGGLSMEMAGAFSMPPENLVTLLAPDFFGDVIATPYWGAAFLWEVSVFVGVAGLILAILGISKKKQGMGRLWAFMVVVMVILALGRHTPLFSILFDWLPGFSRFRGSAKFVFLAALFLSVLAASGTEKLMQGERIGRLGIAVAAMVSLGLFVAGSLLAWGNPANSGLWLRFLNCVLSNPDNYAAGVAPMKPLFAANAAEVAARSLWKAAFVMLLAGGILASARYRPRLAWGVVLLVIVEMFLYAQSTLETFDPGGAVNERVAAFLESRPGDYRILNTDASYAAMSMGTIDIWGDDPSVLRRYAEFVAMTQGIPPDRVRQDIPLAHPHPLLRLLRLRYIFSKDEHGQLKVTEMLAPLPHVFLAHRYQVHPGRDAIFAAMNDARFNPAEEVVLETEPRPLALEQTTVGRAEVIRRTSDSLHIEAETGSPAILVVTDPYAEGWRAVSLPGSAQTHYEVLPANYCLRAIPLGAGRHRLQLVFEPAAFVWGKWISLGSLLVYLGVLGWWAVGRFSGRKSDRSGALPSA